jgi:hypothetical protein
MIINDFDFARIYHVFIKLGNKTREFVSLLILNYTFNPSNDKLEFKNVVAREKVELLLKIVIFSKGIMEYSNSMSLILILQS